MTQNLSDCNRPDMEHDSITTISETQKRLILARLLRSTCEPLDFLSRYGIARIDDLPASRVNSALSWLELQSQYRRQP